VPDFQNRKKEKPDLAQFNLIVQKKILTL